MVIWTGSYIWLNPIKTDS